MAHLAAHEKIGDMQGRRMPAPELGDALLMAVAELYHQRESVEHVASRIFSLRECSCRMLDFCVVSRSKRHVVKGQQWSAVAGKCHIMRGAPTNPLSK